MGSDGRKRISTTGEKIFVSCQHTDMEPAELFREQLPLIARVVGSVCRRAGLRDADAEDFGSMVTLALIENDYAILRAWEGRAPLGAYLTVVAQRLLARERTRLWGRWHASADAERLGDAAVLLEKLLVRDGRSLDEAVPIVRALHPAVSENDVRALAERLPSRQSRPRLVALDGEELEAADSADARTREQEVRKVSERAACEVRETIAGWPPLDRRLMRFHFGAQMSIADVARVLDVPQRPLYRRVEALLRQLRAAIERHGAGAAVVEEIITACAADGLDFGLRDGKSESERHTTMMGDGI